jgi:nitrogen-specific signal transduction histidine kinase
VNGKIVGGVLVFRDVTGANDLLNEKLRNQKLESLGVLAGGIAHDFNNLLMGIQGNISLALLSEGIDDDMVALLNDANQATKRAAVLTTQLLTFAKGGDPHKDILLISDTIKEISNFILTGSLVKCEYDIDDNLWKTFVDRGQIGQVVQNIVINSRQAMGDAGEIHITATNIEKEEALRLNLDEKRFICIEISDNGPGISKDNLVKIFDPYFSTKKDGSGLGLATSFSIIKKHDGFLKTQSKMGKGTTFSIYLPAAPEEIDTGGECNDKTTDDNGSEAVQTRRALIVDDEILIRKLFSLMLRTFGFKVLQAANGEEALNIYKESIVNGEEIEVVLLDLMIPGGMGGEETAKKLLEIDENVKMIVASAYSDSPVLANYKDYGFFGALIKPFQPEDLKKLLLG